MEYADCILIISSVGLIALFIITCQKCFYRKATFQQIISLVLLSPVTAVIVGALIWVFVIMPLIPFGNLLRPISFVISVVAFEAGSLVLFIKATKPYDHALAGFIHISIMIFYFIDFEIFLFSDQLFNHWPAITMILLALFAISEFPTYYCLLSKPFFEMAKRRQQVFGKEFIYVPSIVAAYCLLSHTVFFQLNYSVSQFTSMDPLAVQMVDNMENYTTLIYIFSMLLITFLLIISFHFITKKIKQASEISAQKEEITLARDKVKALSVEIMEALARTIDAKDEYTRGHSIRVAQYSRLIAEKLGLSPEECENIYYYGLLHDIGKIGVPNEIINKPTRLTDEEYEVIKSHPGIGYNILSEIKSRPDLSIGARWHHERVDGRGYPDHKEGEEIPFLARIIAVADGYDAMTSNRSYRRYLPQDVVRAEIEKNIGTQFDERAARCMLQIIDEDPDYRLHE